MNYAILKVKQKVSFPWDFLVVRKYMSPEKILKGGGESIAFRDEIIKTTSKTFTMDIILYYMILPWHSGISKNFYFLFHFSPPWKQHFPLNSLYSLEFSLVTFFF